MQTVNHPSPAERIRTISLQSPTLTLAVAGYPTIQSAWHQLCTSADLLIAVESSSPLMKAPIDGLAELTDSSPLDLPESVRGLAWLRGRVCPVDSALVRLEVESAVWADASGASPATRAELQAAMPDPFWRDEGAWLQHLDADHPDLLALLARRLPRSLRGRHLRPLALDRYGITVRAECDARSHDARSHDVRLPFAVPADDPQALSRALRVLIGCPFLGGVRRRST